jgi:hypothetical protein
VRIGLLVPALLLLAAMAAADATATTQEVPSPSAEPADTLRAAPDSGAAIVPSLAAVDTFPTHAEAIDTLDRGASPNQMIAKCREMDAALRACGQAGDSVARLLHEVQQEESELRRIWPPDVSLFISGPLLGLPGWPVRNFFIRPIYPGRDTGSLDEACNAILGGLSCCTPIPMPAVVATRWERTGLMAKHRVRVNKLVRRNNRIIDSRN